MQGSDGNFYGVAEAGGVDGVGTAFSVTPAGVLTVLHQFSTEKDNGVQPMGGLVQGNDGNFYGVSNRGGAASNGTIYRLTLAGEFTILYSFATTSADDSRGPEFGLVKGSDGNFYGTTEYGGSGENGTLFQITPAGAYTVLHSFASDESEYTEPYALVQGSDGGFYGVTAAGGSAGNGTIFRVTSAGVFTSLYSFSAQDNNRANADGAFPNESLALGRDGNFYGTTQYGGSSSFGTSFRVTPSGVLTAFDLSQDNIFPKNFLRGIDGNIYGIDNFNLFRLNLDAVTVPTGTPVVTLTATTPSVSLGSGGSAVFTLALSAAQDHDVTVNYTVRGGAINGTDYVLLKGAKQIKAGTTTKNIKVKPLGNLGGATQKLVKLTLATGDGYTIGTTGRVKVKITAAP